MNLLTDRPITKGFVVQILRPKALNVVHLAQLPSVPSVIKVPMINIYGQTTYNGDYLSDMTFVIQDQYKYNCHKNRNNHGCGCIEYYLLPDQLKTTTLQVNNIPLQDVVKGKGSLYDKVFAIFNESFFEFYESFIRYGMLKYILIKLIYGEYDLNKLCRNKHKTFIKDLSHSRFCRFVAYFDVDFNQYYIKC